MQLSLNPIYQLSKYLSYLKLLLGFKNAYLLIGRKKLYFTNPNVIGIIEKSNKKLGPRIKIFKLVDLYIDVGAHFGTSSFLFNMVNPKSSILAFEPNPITFKFLKRNFQHTKRIKIYNIGLSDKRAGTTIHIDKQHLDTASLNKNSYYLKRNTRTKLIKKTIEVDKLDNYYSEARNKKRIYLKIDVETHEKNVLLGAQEILKKVKYLELEVYQDKKNRLSDVLDLIPRKYNIVSCDFLIPDKKDAEPKTANVLLELF